MGKVKLGGKQLEPHGFLQENLLEGSGFCFTQRKQLSSHLPNLWVLTVPCLLHPASNQMSLKANQWWEAV